jgi:hypothetical protein
MQTLEDSTRGNKYEDFTKSEYDAYLIACKCMQKAYTSAGFCNKIQQSGIPTIKDRYCYHIMRRIMETAFKGLKDRINADTAACCNIPFLVSFKFEDDLISCWRNGKSIGFAIDIVVSIEFDKTPKVVVAPSGRRR